MNLAILPNTETSFRATINAPFAQRGFEFMALPKSIAIPAIFITIAVIALAVGVITLWVRERDNPPSGSQRENGAAARPFDGAGFHERARQDGIDFHMSFLPGEQGENFKINLYDHGCGVAVADYDGD